MDDGHHRPATAHPLQRGAARAGAVWLAADWAAAAPVADRCVSPVHPPDAGDVPDADRQPPVRHGVCTRLSRQPRSLPPPDRLPPAAAESRGVSTSAYAARRTGTNRLGSFWIPYDRPGAPPTDGVR